MLMICLLNMNSLLRLMVLSLLVEFSAPVGLFEFVRLRRFLEEILGARVDLVTPDALKPQFGHWVIFDHCMPFDITRAYDEATQYRDPRIWTAERDMEMWKALQS